MKYGLLISAIVEIVGGLIVFFAPQLVLNDGVVVFSLAKMYSVLTLAVGIINVFAYIHFDDSKLGKKIFLTMFFFHGAIALMSSNIMVSTFKHGMTGTYLHLTMFVLFVFLYLKDVKPSHESV